MRAFLLFLVLFVTVSAQAQTMDTVPARLNPTLPLQPSLLVHDLTGVFSEPQRHYLERLLVDYDHRTTTQIAIVTLDSSHTTDADFDDYTLELANRWGVGTSGKNNGILIGISVDLRRIRIQNGWEIEKKLGDAQTKQHIDRFFLPKAKQGNYYGATHDLVSALMRHLGDGPFR